MMSKKLLVCEFFQVFEMYLTEYFCIIFMPGFDELPPATIRMIFQDTFYQSSQLPII